MTRMIIDSIENPIDISTERVSVLSFEDIRLYAKVIRSLHFISNGEDGEMNIWALDDNGKQINMANVELICDPLAIDFSSRKITTGLINRLKSEFNTDVDTFCSIEAQLQEVQHKVIDVMSDFSLPVEFDDKWDASRIVKALSISIASDCYGMSHLDILNNYLSVAEELNIANLHCFVGLNQILSSDDLNIFYKNVLHAQVPVICIQRSEFIPSANPFTNILHVDKDYEEYLVITNTEDKNKHESSFYYVD